MEGVGLGEAGQAEVARTAERLAGEGIEALYSSPLQRTRETAAAIGRRLGLAVEVEPGLNELDFGDWTGRGLEDLHRDPLWEPWNARRSLNRPPGGESMGEAQMRALRAVEAICAHHRGQTVAAVSHSDIIKCLLMHYLGLNLDFFHRFEVDPGSISWVVVGDWGAKVLGVNHRPQ